MKGAGARAKGPVTPRPPHPAQDLPHARRRPRLAGGGPDRLNRGNLLAPSRTTLEEAAKEWFAAAEAGIVRARSGYPCKPSALRAYEQALRAKLLPALGHLKLSAVTRNAVQDLVDRLVAEGQRPRRSETPFCPCGPSTAAPSRARRSTSTRPRASSRR